MNILTLKFAKMMCILHGIPLKYAKIYAYVLENGNKEIILDKEFKEKITKELKLADITIRIAFSELEKTGVLKRMGRGKYWCEKASDIDFRKAVNMATTIEIDDSHRYIKLIIEDTLEEG